MINFTAIIDNNMFLLNSASISIVGARLSEGIFNFPDNTLRKVYTLTSPELQVEGDGTTQPVLVIRDCIIVINDQDSPIAADIYTFLVSSTIIGVHSFTGIRVSQPATRAVVEVIPGEYIA